MDLATKAQQALSPEATPTLLRTASFHPPSPPGFPIIAIAIIGILATALLLVGYYVFVIKCCLSWHRVDILRRFSLASPSDEEDGLALRTALEPRGLDEATIRSIPVFLFKHDGHSDTECSVCLNEFEDCQKLRLIPSCRHAFHVDCIDVWLQSNANCPLCRAAVTHFQLTDRILAPSPSPADPGPLAGDDDFVVIELGAGVSNAGVRRKLQKGTSMGDECIDTKRDKDGEFSVQPIRRSFSMDSSADRKMFVAVQEALAHQREVNAEGSCSGSRSARRSFFSFGHGNRGSSRSAVLPVYSEP